MLERMWDLLVDSLIGMFMPLVCAYFTLTSNVFLNTAAQNADGFEKLGNSILTPVQYILVGQEAVPQEDGTWKFVQKFDYDSLFWFKTASSFAALPPSLVLGSCIKGISLLGEKTRQRHLSILATKASTQIDSNNEMYQKIGLTIGEATEILTCQGHLRKEGDEKNLALDKEALRDIGQVLNEADIHWWVDCGTCLGALRYGGVIPWDEDVDIAVLQPDFENVRRALNKLDRDKYLVQNWSSRTHPDSWLKVFIRESGTTLDIYHFKILPETKEIAVIFSYENHFFFPDWWKIRERRFKVPVSFDIVFPLKKANFDGVQVFVPNHTEKYLQRYYGENLDPVKVYDSKTGLYEKDLTHPYWKRAYVH